MIRYLLHRLVIPYVLKKPCPERIPRTGDKAEKINCYIVAFDNNNSPFFVALDTSKDGLTGVVWNGHKFAEEASISWSESEKNDLVISHYYGTAEVTYTSIYRFIWHSITKLIYVKIHSHRLVENIDQYFFNKRKLVTKKRMELLQFMMEDQLNRTHNGIDVLDLMTKLYSVKWVLHPTRVEQERRLEFYLESLVASKDIEKINREYVVTGNAIQTIEKYYEEEKKYLETVKLQKKMFYVTVILALMAMIQAGIIKLPTLIDWTKLF